MTVFFTWHKERHSTFSTKGGKSEREDSALERRERWRDCITKEGEKRSLFYSGGARPAIWSYKINHSRSLAVGAMCQINRSSLLTSLLATLLLPPTSIIRPPISLFLSLIVFRISRLARSSRIHEINPLRVLWRASARKEEECGRERRAKKTATQCAALYIRILLFEDLCIARKCQSWF